MSNDPLRPAAVAIEVSAGELIDKLTILQIKRERITVPDKLRNIEFELALLTAARDRVVSSSKPLDGLTTRLKRVNEELWDIEDAIRRCEAAKDFGPRFVELARSVYHKNDLRSRLKREINELLGSAIVEEKDYESYE
jgi:hypothetical protein